MIWPGVKIRDFDRTGPVLKWVVHLPQNGTIGFCPTATCPPWHKKPESRRCLSKWSAQGGGGQLAHLESRRALGEVAPVLRESRFRQSDRFPWLNFHALPHSPCPSAEHLHDSLDKALQAARQAEPVRPARTRRSRRHGQRGS